MNPPEEQLIRDYVNRVSVAARGRLSPDDRRAFVARTRELIEQNTRGAGQVGPIGVARFLNGLGDPAALVARECDRLAAQPPDAATAPPAGDGPRRPRPSRERRPRPARSAWLDRLRPSGGALSGVPVPRPSAPGSDASEGGAVSAAGPGSAAPGSAVPGDAVRGGARPRPVLAGDVVTGPVPTGEEPLPGPPSESISRPVPGPPAGAVPEPVAESLPGPPVEATGPPPLPADVRPGPRRLGWPWQGMRDPEAGRAGVNGHGPQPKAEDAAEARSRPAGPAAASPGPAAPGAADSAGPPTSGEDLSGLAATVEAARDEPGPAASSAATPGSPASNATEPGADGEAAASSSPDAGRAPVIGRWAGGAPVTGDQAAAAHSPGSSNGRAAANGHGPAGEVAASDFTDDDVTASDVPSRPDAASRPAHDGPGDAGAPAGEEPGAAPADPQPSDRGARGRWMGGTGQGVGSWAGWKPAHPAKPRPSRFRSSLHPPSLPWPALPSGALEATGAVARKAARYAAGRARERPLEAAAVVLIGLGGAIYPPVWLLGAALALASRVWDFRDKWLGLAIPLFAVIVGMGADVSLSGAQSSFTAYFREAWIFGGHLGRIVAVLGAVYLAWRSQRPRREQSAEPWNNRRRLN